MARDPLNPRILTPADLADAAMRSLGSGFGNIVALFHEVAGPRLAAHAVATSLRSGTLTVRCSSASWAQSINLMEQDLLDRLNARLGPGTVTRIHARAGAPPTKPQPQPEAVERAALEPLDPAQAQQLQQLVADIDDPVLREKLLAAAQASTRRRNSTR